MCPFIIFTFLLTILLLLFELSAALLTVTYNITNNAIKLHETQSMIIDYRILSPSSNELNGNYRFLNENPNILQILSVDNRADSNTNKQHSNNGYQKYDFEISPNDIAKNNEQNLYEYNGKLQIQGKFLGYSYLELQKQQLNDANNSIWNPILIQNNKNLIKNNYELIVSIIRDKDLISKVFIYSVAIVVSVSYINMGCALDLNAVYDVMRRPIAPAIGLFSQYVCMPLISFMFASLFFEETYLKLGIFIFGCSPGGGASNMWTVLVNGNLNLSITMTFLSTMLSIGLMPFWLYTLGRTIFEGTSTTPPFRNIFTTLFTMVIFLGIGLLIKHFLPRVAAISRRILAPFSGIMIIFIIVFGTYANFYMFKVMTLKMIIAAAINVWFGMFLGFTLAYLFRKPLQDMLTIAIETGVQNTGVSIVVLALSLGQPDADLASALPVAASIMTPIPLTIAWLIMRTNYCNKIISNANSYDGIDADNHNNHMENDEKNIASTANDHNFNLNIDGDNCDDKATASTASTATNTTATMTTNQSNSNESSRYSSKVNLRI